jgi:hypothetical protein
MIAQPDPPEFTEEELESALRRVGEEARRKAFAAGLPITVQENSHLVRIWPDGRRELLEKAITGVHQS